MDWEFVFRDRGEQAANAEWSRCGLDHVRLEGDISPLLNIDAPRVAIVGSRNPSPCGKMALINVLHALSCSGGEEKPIVISGLALGTDICAHSLAMDKGLPTFAVLPNGLDHVYPSAHTGFAKRMTETPGCGLLTQFPDNIAPESVNFIDQKRTIALMSDIVIVICAEAKSSSVLTARFAKEFGVPVYAFPGEVGDPRSAGCNQLIHNGIAEIIPNVDYLSEIFDF